MQLSVGRDLHALLDAASPHFDKGDPALAYAFDLPQGTGKVVVRVNHADKVRISGQRSRIVANFVRTGCVIRASDITNLARYLPLEK